MGKFRLIFREKIGYIFDILLILFFSSFISGDGNFQAYSVIFVVLLNILFSLFDFKKHIIFASFNLTLFFFLLGRVFVFTVLGFNFEYGGIFDLGFSSEIANQIVRLIGISVYSYSFSYFLIQPDEFSIKNSLFVNLLRKLFNKYIPKPKVKKVIKENNKFRKYLRYISLALFIFSVICRIYVLIKEYRLVAQIGYRESYLIANNDMSQFDRLLNSFSRIELATFAIIIATKPKLKLISITSILFVIPSFISFASGARAEVILRIILVTIILIYNIENQKIINRILLGLFIIIPIFLLLFIFIESTRGTDTSTSKSIFEKIARLFYNQGVSARAIGATIKYQDQIPSKFYSFSEIIDFINFNIISRFNGVIKPQGQSIEVVLQRTELSHVISFLQHPFDYLNKGLGVGSSYISELYLDFGYIGLILGSIFYGILFEKLGQWIKNSSTFIAAISLLVLKNLFFTPRASFSFILRDILSETQIITFIFVFGLAYIFEKICRKEKI